MYETKLFNFIHFLLGYIWSTNKTNWTQSYAVSKINFLASDALFQYGSFNPLKISKHDLTTQRKFFDQLGEKLSIHN